MFMNTDITVVQFPGLGLGPWRLNRFVFQDLFGFLSVAWYGLIICVAMILACVVILRNATKKEGFEVDSFLDYFIFCIPFGVIGARLMYVLAMPNLYRSFADVIAIWNGGLAIYGGVIVGAIVAFVVAKIKKNSVLKVFDAIIPGLLLGQAIGRWGNFVNGEAHGVNTDLPWGMWVDLKGPFHPTFLYESIITFTGFLLAMFVIYRFKKSDGQVFAFYLIWYGIGRALVEGLRTDSLMVGPLRLSQCIGILSALAGIVMLVVMHLMRKNMPVAVTAEGEAPQMDAAQESDKKEEAPKKKRVKKLSDEQKKEEEKTDDQTEEKEEKKDDGTDH